ncbi:hydroxyethylthiazole kinase, partial [Staphylococcus epidermidis]|uniref:hydroxyethylthiazole kinase n=1 Tax=Staphylococcus epidermidis TaxID=1282 RepID=UPI0016427FDC
MINNLQPLPSQNPLLICYTNHLLKNFTPNPLLTLPPTPAITQPPQQPQHFTPIPTPLLINLPTLTRQNEQDITKI